MTEKPARCGLRVHQDYEADVLKQVTVADVMTCEVPTIKADLRLGELADRIARHDPLLTQHQALPILDAGDHLVSIITRGDVLRALDNGEQEKTVLEAGSDALVTAYPEESVHDAISQMLEYNIGRLPVVSRDDPQRLIGYLGCSSVMQAGTQRLEEEARREPGWITHFRSASKLDFVHWQK